MSDPVIAGPEAATVDLRIITGYPVDFEFRLLEDGVGVDLTDMTATCQVRPTAVSSIVLLELDVEFTIPQTDDDKGRGHAFCSATDTEDLRPMVGVYDIRFVADDEPTRRIKGSALIEAGVTQEVAS